MFRSSVCLKIDRRGLASSGVPQGSVLGPVLFLIYVNEIPSLISSKTKMFADDTKIYRAIRDDQDSYHLQNDLATLERWSKDWLLLFNPLKCKVMHCGMLNSKTEYYMTSQEGTRKIQETKLEKDLGAIVADNLKPASHCQKAASRGMTALRLMKASFDRIDIVNFRILFTTYVRPHLEYCMQAIGPYTAQDIKIIERVQRRATKLVKSIKNLSYEDRLRKLKMPRIEERLRRGDLIETYKILTGKENVRHEQFFDVEHKDRTRGHQLKLKKRRVKHASRLKFFSNRVINEWNCLPGEVVKSESTNAFKNGIDKLHCDWATAS